MTVHAAIVDGALVIEGAGPVTFPRPVEEALVFDDVVVVRLAATSDLTQNVLGVSRTGEVVWQVRELPVNRMSGAYLAIHRVNDAVVSAYHSMGGVFERGQDGSGPLERIFEIERARASLRALRVR